MYGLGKMTSVYGLQQENISTRTIEDNLLQCVISIQERLACSRNILAHDKGLPCYSA